MLNKRRAVARFAGLHPIDWLPRARGLALGYMLSPASRACILLDRKIWFDTANQLHGLQKTMNEAAERATELSEKINAIQQALKDNATASAALKTRVEDFAKKFEPVGRRFGVGAENPFETAILSASRRICVSVLVV